MRRWRQRTLSMAVAAGASTLALLAAVAPAQAQPATTVSYPAWSSATRYVGERHLAGVGQAQGWPLGGGLLPGQPQPDDVHRVRAPLLTLAPPRY